MTQRTITLRVDTTQLLDGLSAAGNLETLADLLVRVVLGDLCSQASVVLAAHGIDAECKEQ